MDREAINTQDIVSQRPARMKINATLGPLVENGYPGTSLRSEPSPSLEGALLRRMTAFDPVEDVAGGNKKVSTRNGFKDLRGGFDERFDLWVIDVEMFHRM